MLESMKHAADMLRRAVSAVWALGGRERRHRERERRIIDAILANLNRNEPMPHLQEKDPPLLSSNEGL